VLGGVTKEIEGPRFSTLVLSSFATHFLLITSSFAAHCS
jgi:hypothetical protein